MLFRPHKSKVLKRRIGSRFFCSGERGYEGPVKASEERLTVGEVESSKSGTPHTQSIRS
jgi:hypothetical protein